MGGNSLFERPQPNRACRLTREFTLLILFRVAGDCGDVLQGLLGTAACAAKSDPTFKNAPKAAAGDCAGAAAAIGGFDADCCPGLRALVTSVRFPAGCKAHSHNCACANNDSNDI
jgi:hypothetical protein